MPDQEPFATASNFVRCLVLAATLLSSACTLSNTNFSPRSGAVLADTTADQRALRLAAWEDQIAFERFRIQNLPQYFSPTRSLYQGCDEELGRFCLDPGNAKGAWHFIPEGPVIAERRLELVAALRDVGRRVPQDDWVVGQWVRYAVEAELYADALQAALGCTGTGWWCAALAGYVLHRSGDPEGALNSFSIALIEMPDAERLRWLDPAPVLGHNTIEEVRAASLDAFYEFIDLFWHLADPFLSRPGNEVLTEHLSRRVEIQFQYAAGFLEGLPWGEDLDRIHLRYGTPWSRIAGRGLSFCSTCNVLAPPYSVADLISNYRVPALELLPPIADQRPGTGEWDRINRFPYAGYNLAIEGRQVQWLPAPEHQVAVFRRGESALIVAAIDPTAHNLPADSTLEYGIAFLPWDDLFSTPISARANGEAGAAPLMVAVPPQPGLLSLEVISHERAAVSRLRRQIETIWDGPDAFAISDILLIEGESRPESLGDALRFTRGSSRVQVGEVVGLFWEVYGIDPVVHPEVTITLSLIPERPGILGRLARLFGLGPATAASRIRWQEPTKTGSEMPNFIALTIPELRDGTHLLEVIVEAGSNEPLVTGREVVVGGSSGGELPRGELTRRPVLRRDLCQGARHEPLEVGNEENLRISQEFRESEAFRDYWANNWEFPPVDVPSTMLCQDYVLLHPEYFGLGSEPR